MFWSKLAQLLQRHLPLIGVSIIALFIALQSIKPGTYYSGWDNVHGEFNFLRYARQVGLGAWLEHEGMGGPAAQGHLSEAARLPILFALKVFLPDHLIRYTYILTAYVIGGISVYFYLIKVWLSEKTRGFKVWLGGLGSLFYLLHMLTVQQFYISFEMFMAQYAFLPFVLLGIHRLAKGFTAPSILLFLLAQLLIAPSGHTPTVFYLGVLFTLMYAFFLKLSQGLVKATTFSFMIGLLTLLANAFWVLPNLYYSLNNSHYVHESHDNQLFGPESLWSVREAVTVPRMLQGTHYLFNWRDFSMDRREFDFILSEWETHFAQPLVTPLLQLLGVITLLGVIFIIIDRTKDTKRWGVLLFYLFCVTFIWIDLFPTKVILDWLYQFDPFLEVFRNPFTKLSILYSFVSLLLFIQVCEFVTQQLVKTKAKAPKVVAGLLLSLVATTIMYTSWPAFQGQLISEKLKVSYPTQYTDMFAYLNSRDRNLRVLQLPQLSHAGWEYYDWQFIEKGNGYQGMGFYYFGMPQPALQRDFDRWVETSDFFYHELKYGLDTRDSDILTSVLDKYNVDLVIVDETKFDPNRVHDHQFDHRLVTDAGLQQVWHKDFLTIYERIQPGTEEELLVPASINKINTQAERVRADYAFYDEGDYLVTPKNDAHRLYPFSDLMSKEPSHVTFTETGAQLQRSIPQGNYVLKLPGHSDYRYRTPIALRFDGLRVSVTFPRLNLRTNNQEIQLPQLSDFAFTTDEASESVLVVINDTAFRIDQGQTTYPVLELSVGQPLTVTYAPTPSQLAFTETGAIDGTNLEFTEALTLEPNWAAIKQDLNMSLTGLESITITSTFPTRSLNVTQNPSINCGVPARGTFSTEVLPDKVVYQADKYGVNCNGYDLDYVSTAYPYLFHIQGKNHQGRGLKFFLNYNDPNVLPEDYLLQKEDTRRFIALHPISDLNRSGIFLNWETRSLGKLAVSELHHLQLTPFPLNHLSRLTLEPVDSKTVPQNNLHILSQKLWFDSIHLIDARCESSECVLGLDQTYDDLWLGLTSEGKLLPHFRLNSWANAWLLDRNGKIVLIYLPEIISLLSMTVLGITTIVVVVKSIKRKSYDKNN